MASRSEPSLTRSFRCISALPRSRATLWPKVRRLDRTACRRASSVSKIVPKRNGNTVPAAEAHAHDSGVFEDVLLPELHVVALVFADHYVEFTAGIGKNGGSVHALNPFQ